MRFWVASIHPWKLKCVVVFCIFTQSVCRKKRSRVEGLSDYSPANPPPAKSPPSSPPTTTVAYSLSASESYVCGGHGGDRSVVITAWNTFQDAVVTHGQEIILDAHRPPALSDGLKSLSTPPDNSFPLGFYHINYTSNSITYTLPEKSAGSHLILPDDSFDRFYFHIKDRVFVHASIAKSEASGDSTVEILPAGFTTDLIDPFATGITIPEMSNGGLLVSVFPGADATQFGENIVICYSLAGATCGTHGSNSDVHITVWNTFEDMIDTQGMEAIWDVDGPISMVDGVDFHMFPSNPPDNDSPLGFYDIDVSKSNIVYTLRNNSAASHLVFPEGSFDRYYFDFGIPVRTASIVTEETSILSTVEILEPGYTVNLTDPFDTEIESPSLTNGGILVAVVPRANITELGQHIVICYSLQRNIFRKRQDRNRSGGARNGMKNLRTKNMRRLGEMKGMINQHRIMTKRTDWKSIELA